MNAKTLGLLRELLTAAGAALVAYGYGTETLWQEATGGIVAAVCLIWGVLHNKGAEAWYSLARKVFSSVAGILVLLGVLDPDKAQVLFGMVISGFTLIWSAAVKDTTEPPPPVGLILALLACGFMVSCAEYPITGSVSLRDPSSGAKAGLWFTPGAAPRATVKIPVYDEQTGELIGMADLSSDLPLIRDEK